MSKNPHLQTAADPEEDHTRDHLEDTQDIRKEEALHS